MKKLEKVVNLRLSKELLEELDVVINGVDVFRKSDDKKLDKNKGDKKKLSRNDFLLVVIRKGLEVVYKDISDSDKSKYLRSELGNIELEENRKEEDLEYYNSVCGNGVSNSDDFEFDGSEIDIVDGEIRF